jgi:Ca2+-binding EF-hand superfamily protein
VLCRPTTAGPGIAESEVEALFKTLDTNDSGYLDYAEMLKGQQMLEKVLRD